jgi:hypothetical protein
MPVWPVPTAEQGRPGRRAAWVASMNGERALSWLSRDRRLAAVRWDRGSQRRFVVVLLACARRQTGSNGSTGVKR